MLQKTLLIIAAFTFTLTSFAQEWKEVQRFEASDTEAEAFFGYDVAIYGNHAVIGRMPSNNAPCRLAYFIPKTRKIYPTT